MRKTSLTLVVLLFIATSCFNVYGEIVAYWDFEDGIAGESFTPAGEANGSGGSTDLIGGYLIRGWDDYYGPSFTDDAPNGLAMSNADNHQDGYCSDETLAVWSPSVWTIECAIYLEEISGWETFIGRDGSSQSESEADFYLVNNGIDDKFRVNFDTVGGQRWVLDGDYTVEINTWYHIAAMSDGANLTMWLDDGSGYQPIGKLDISAQTVADNALAATNYTWTFGRGWYGGSFVDHIDGKMDDIRFMDTSIIPASGNNATPHNNDGSVGVLQEEDETVDLDLSFKATVDPNDVVDTNLLKHYIYLSNGEDPNLVLYATVDHVDYGNANVTYSIEGLKNGAKYYWCVEEGFNSGSGSAYPAGNANNVKSVTWSFTTVGLTPSIISGPNDTVAKPDAVLSVAGSPGAKTYQWFKVAEPDDIQLADEAPYSGTTTSELTISDVTLAEEGQYYCIAYNGQTPSEPSRSAYVWMQRMIGHWKFDDNLSDSVTDTVAGVPVHDGTIVTSSAATEADGIISYEAGIDGNAVSFDNDGDYVEIPGSEYFNFMPGDFTVSIWYKVNAPTGWLLPISKLDVETSGWLIGADSANTNQGTFIIEVPNTRLDGRSEVDTTDGQWHMLTMAYDADASTFSSYTDGERDGFATGVSITPEQVPAAPINIGGFETQLTINGAIDDVRIYSYDLSATEIAALYNEMRPDEYVCLATLDDTLAYDLDDDCRITVTDFALLAQDWLVCERYPSISCEW